MQTDNTSTQFEQVMREIHRFVSFALARSFAARGPKRLWIMLGDDGRFWVTTPANCARLQRWGYEFAE